MLSTEFALFRAKEDTQNIVKLIYSTIVFMI
jgi:hypothetical protein